MTSDYSFQELNKQRLRIPGVKIPEVVYAERELDNRGLFRSQTALFDAAKGRLAADPVNSPHCVRLKQYGIKRPPGFTNDIINKEAGGTCCASVTLSWSYY